MATLDRRTLARLNTTLDSYNEKQLRLMKIALLNRIIHIRYALLFNLILDTIACITIIAMPVMCFVDITTGTAAVLSQAVLFTGLYMNKRIGKKMDKRLESTNELLGHVVKRVP
jgi:hypothetical protein